jgi:hypothetical protein
VDGALEAMLLPDALAARTALVLALWSLERERDRRLVRIREEMALVAPRAREAVELRDRLAAIDREGEAITEVTRRRPDPLHVLAALGERLPAGATVLRVQVRGDDWQIDGTAPDAAAIVPLLDRDERFEGVRFLSASARFREGDRTYGTFSIALRVRPGP